MSWPVPSGEPAGTGQDTGSDVLLHHRSQALFAVQHGQKAHRLSWAVVDGFR
ncbi:unnamed protein product [[Actinomadura] parvosata subsp. kistnae]|nr:unnamed protein product [Actinomadura parvosata subsp. kistnae]